MDEYLDYLRRRKVRIPDGYGQVQKEAEIVRAAPSERPAALPALPLRSARGKLPSIRARASSSSTGSMPATTIPCGTWAMSRSEAGFSTEQDAALAARLLRRRAASRTQVGRMVMYKADVRPAVDPMGRDPGRANGNPVGRLLGLCRQPLRAVQRPRWPTRRSAAISTRRRAARLKAAIPEFRRHRGGRMARSGADTPDEIPTLARWSYCSAPRAGDRRPCRHRCLGPSAGHDHAATDAGARRAGRSQHRRRRSRLTRRDRGNRRGRSCGICLHRRAHYPGWDARDQAVLETGRRDACTTASASSGHGGEKEGRVFQTSPTGSANSTEFAPGRSTARLPRHAGHGADIERGHI